MNDDEPSAWAKDFMRRAHEQTQNARIVFQIGDTVKVDCAEIGASIGTISNIWVGSNGKALYGVEINALPIYKIRWFRECEVEKVQA